MSSLQNVFKKIKTEKNNYVFNIKNNNKISYENLYINSLSKFSFLSGFKQKKILVVVNNSIDYLEILIIYDDTNQNDNLVGDYFLYSLILRISPVKDNCIVLPPHHALKRHHLEKPYSCK